VDFGLYIRRMLMVRSPTTGRVPALIYISPQRATGRPRPGYITLVVEAAREWGLPEPYIASLQRWSPSRWRGARVKDTGDAR
jgi:AIG2-like family